ncbi:hypothetical protein [Alloactinosynnema sp. L-07]|nr:hypothetical protein [Alloactinosynnema sp. L-07]
MGQLPTPAPRRTPTQTHGMVKGRHHPTRMPERPCIRGPQVPAFPPAPSSRQSLVRSRRCQGAACRSRSDAAGALTTPTRDKTPKNEGATPPSEARTSPVRTQRASHRAPRPSATSHTRPNRRPLNAVHHAKPSAARPGAARQQHPPPHGPPSAVPCQARPPAPTEFCRANTPGAPGPSAAHASDAALFPPTPRTKLGGPARPV